MSLVSDVSIPTPPADSVPVARRDGRTSALPVSAKRKFGALLVIMTAVSVQFVEIQLISFDGIAITLQKLASAIFLPLGALLLGRIVLPRGLMVVGALFLLSLSISWIAGVPDAEIAGHVFPAVLNIIAAAILFTALIDEPDNLRIFGMVWVYAAVASSVITVLQFIHVLPLFNVPADYQWARVAVDGFVRATGLKYDPNFQAVMLVIGLVFARFFTQSLTRRLISAVIMLGVLCTLSRMGTLVAICVIVLTPVLFAGTGRDGPRRAGERVYRVLITMGSGILVGYAVVLSLPPHLRDYVFKRMGDLVESAELFGQIDGSVALQSSGHARAFIMKGAFNLFSENWLFGVGAGRTKELLYQAGYLENVAHNSYLELLCIGGITGLVTLAVFAAVIWGAVSGLGGNVGPPGTLSAARFLAAVFAFCALFLSFPGISIIWVLLAFFLAVRHYRDQVASSSGRIVKETDLAPGV
jgi:O-antigen ligase